MVTECSVPQPTLPAAVLFDMDGLLVDTEPLWTVVQIELAERHGGTWTPELKARVIGTRLETAVPLMLEGLGITTTPELVVQTMSAVLHRMVELFQSALVARPGALDLIAYLRSAGVPIALVSSSYRVLVDAVLSALELTFDLTLAGDEVVRAKPDPEPYATAAVTLGVDVTRCVVLEDSPAGVASGEAAWCAVVAVPSVAGVVFEVRPRRWVRDTLAGMTAADLGTLLDGG